MSAEPRPGSAISAPRDDFAVGVEPTAVQRFARLGIEACRRGEWERGLVFLGRVTERDYRDAELPGVFFSYLGLGIARADKKYREGLRLCRHGLKRQFYEPDNYANLAEVLLLTGDRRRATRAIVKGLKLDSHHLRLRRLRRSLGMRRRPVLPFLARSGALNRLLGRLRHRLRNPTPED